MEAIGRLIDTAYVTQANLATTWISLKDTEAVTVILVGASGATNATFNVATSSAGANSHAYDGTANGGDGVTRFFRKAASTGLWVLGTQAAAATVATTAVAGDQLAVDIAGYQLPQFPQITPGYRYIQVTHASANVMYVAHDLVVQRKPANLRSLVS